MLPHAYEKINVVFLFIGKLEWFSNRRFALLLNEYYFHKENSTGVVGVAWSCHMGFSSGLHILE